MSCTPKNTVQNYIFSAKIELNLQKTYIDYGIFAVLIQKGIGLSPNSLPLRLTLPYPKLLLKPLSNGCLIDMQEQVPLYVPYNLCRDVIG